MNSNLLLVLLTSLLSCGGQLCQKQAARQRTRGGVIGWLLSGLLLLAAGMLIWLRVLQRLPVSLAYPMLSLNFMLVALAARLIWREKLSRQQWLGTLLIVVGVALMGRYA
ncbi:EamA family transporter (plasmid) [Duffyella gerundensis]|uniref:4-amino-4-deoxy-L-arabinose-phosphoundecaprenol flippase subunit ArnE n=1 Tax=Duffyella gerundensis TaxID=1619313 RepID=UPI001AEA791A|nr:4-amino-4-deoxy-L-arabinose-phosphoundecaprenol flippase subunit ArnE [Duffyella gerundensis]QTO56501.1 EamA family transporter [Duffyella gerundensis]